MKKKLNTIGDELVNRIVLSSFSRTKKHGITDSTRRFDPDLNKQKNAEAIICENRGYDGVSSPIFDNSSSGTRKI